MTTSAKKRDSDAPESGSRRQKAEHGKKQVGPFVCDPPEADTEVILRTNINYDQMRAFQRQLENWVKENATDSEGNQWSQHEIGDKLGIAQTIVGAWKGGKKRPGIVSLLRLRKKFRMSLDEMLGLPPLRVR